MGFEILYRVSLCLKFGRDCAKFDTWVLHDYLKLGFQDPQSDIRQLDLIWSTFHRHGYTSTWPWRSSGRYSVEAFRCTSGCHGCSCCQHRRRMQTRSGGIAQVRCTLSVRSWFEIIYCACFFTTLLYFKYFIEICIMHLIHLPPVPNVITDGCHHNNLFYFW